MRSRIPGTRVQGPATDGRAARNPVCAALLAIVALALVYAVPAQAAAPGSLDPAFGSGGVASLGAGTQLFGVAVQPNGQPVAAGQSGGKVLVERFTTAGKPSGVYVGPAGYARAVAIQADGKIVIAGSSGGAMLVERLTASLTPDPTFGSGGRVAVFAGQSAIANAVGIGSDGSIATAGSVNPPNTQVGAARLSANGRVQWGKVLNLGDYSVATGLAVQPADNKIVLVGRQTPLQITNAVVARLTTNGSLDSSFRGGGAFTYSQANAGYTALTSVTLQRDGKIVAAGDTVIDQPLALFLRINSNGTLDSSFGAGGAATLPAGDGVIVPTDPIGAYGVGIAAGGRIVGAGNYEHTSVEVDAAAYALTSRGSPQPGFGTGGVVRAPTGAIESCSLAVAPNGNLIAAGDAVSTFPNKNPCSPSGASQRIRCQLRRLRPRGATPAAACPEGDAGGPQVVLQEVGCRQERPRVRGRLQPRVQYQRDADRKRGDREAAAHRHDHKEVHEGARPSPLCDDSQVQPGHARKRAGEAGCRRSQDVRVEDRAPQQGDGHSRNRQADPERGSDRTTVDQADHAEAGAHVQIGLAHR